MKDTSFDEKPRIPVDEWLDVRAERAALSSAEDEESEKSEAEESDEEQMAQHVDETEQGDPSTLQDDTESDESESDEYDGDRIRQSSSRLKRQIGALLSGSILSKAEVRKFYPYMLLLAFLMLLYIANVFKMQQLHKQHDRLAAEVKELRAKSLTLSSIRMNATRQSEILKELKKRGIDLEESVVPPKIIDK